MLSFKPFISHKQLSSLHLKNSLYSIGLNTLAFFTHCPVKAEHFTWSKSSLEASDIYFHKVFAFLGIAHCAHNFGRG